MSKKHHKPKIDAAKMTVFGACELCALPDLGVSAINTRIDTGAQTSALHAVDIAAFEKAGQPWLHFVMPADDYDSLKLDKKCEYPIHDIRRIKSSNGQAEKRYVIVTTLHAGHQSWQIELTLADRSAMSHMMLLGRQAMGSNVLVYPHEMYLLADG